MDLDPELAQIAEAARRQVKHSHIETERMGGPETVNIVVCWRPHPRDLSAQEERWAFTMRRVCLPLSPCVHSNTTSVLIQHDTFRELFDETADLAGIMTDQLVVSHDQRRVFASGTPHSLHMWAEGDLGLFILPAVAIAVADYTRRGM